MECAGNGRALLEPRPISQPWLTEAVGTARWRGVRLAELLEEAAPRDTGVDVVFAGLDRGVEGDVEQRYERSLPLAEALESGAVLAYEMNGAPLPPQHGFPLRLVVPGWYGMTNVKWVSTITVVTEPFAGYQVASGYRFRQSEDEEGRPVTRMRPRSLMVPPGIPEFETRVRILDVGPVLLQGRAWSGRAPIERVEVSTDDGSSWADAALTRDLEGPWAWCGWSFPWDAVAGEHVLCARATDETGDTPAARARVESRRLREQRRAARSRPRALNAAEPPGGGSAARLRSVEGGPDRRRPRVHAELRVRVLEVPSDRPPGDPEPRRDLRVRQALRHETDDLVLATRQPLAADDLLGLCAHFLAPGARFAA